MIEFEKGGKGGGTDVSRRVACLSLLPYLTLPPPRLRSQPSKLIFFFTTRRLLPPSNTKKRKIHSEA